MQIDMDKAVVNYYMKCDRQKKISYRICDYLIKEAREGWEKEKERLLKQKGKYYDDKDNEK